jgi:ubiquinone/menaquinone biosynthesis C-methylase UbiE
MTSDSSRQEDYAFRDDENIAGIMQTRRATLEGAFLMSYLHPGMSLVDFGCGQGTITAGFAEAVAPAEVMGFDQQAEHIERARNFVAEQGLSNVRFEVGDVFEPPCKPASFDVAFANAVLSHLDDPDACLKVMHGTLKSGGLVALRDRGGGGFVRGVNQEVVWHGFELMVAVLDSTSRNPYGSQTMGEVLNRMCREAGFENAIVSATWEVVSGAQMSASGFCPLGAGLASRVVELGLATQAEVAEYQRPYREWLADPDAYIAVPWMEVVARKP